MSEKPKINAGILKEKELLEKLSLEISRDFSISEKLAKKFIFETHINLEKLKKEIINEQINKTEEEKNINFSNKKLAELLEKIRGAKNIIETSSQKEIYELKEILEKTNLLFSLEVEEDSDLIKKLFSDKLLNRVKNSTHISDHIMSASLGIFNSGILFTDVFISIAKGVVTSIPDLIQVLSGKAEIESFKKI